MAAACKSDKWDDMNRRNFLKAATAAVASLHAAPKKQKVAIFSKHLQFLHGEELAQGAAEIGFDGIDLTVRRGGHVEPNRVTQDLPPLVKTIRDSGLEVPMITSDIVDADTPNTELILRTISELGIRHYRWGGFKYDDKTPIPEQLEALKPRVAKLAKLNAKYQTGAMFHTHSGIGVVGAPIWDLYILLKDFDPKAVGVNYDIGHATIEGGYGGWIDSFRVTGPYLQGVAVKDCVWAKDAKGNWKSKFVPLGEGMVKLREFFNMLRARDFEGPLQLHFEYPLGGAESGASELKIPKQEVYTAMKRDLDRLRAFLA
jgi:sugar phosphate isomerase/epimerase